MSTGRWDSVNGFPQTSLSSPWVSSHWRELWKGAAKWEGFRPLSLADWPLPLSSDNLILGFFHFPPWKQSCCVCSLEPTLLYSSSFHSGTSPVLGQWALKNSHCEWWEEPKKSGNAGLSFYSPLGLYLIAKCWKERAFITTLRAGGECSLTVDCGLDPWCFQ